MFSADRRLNRRRMQDLRAEVRELRRLGERQVRHDLHVRDDARIGGEHAVDVGPDLNLRRAEARADDRRRVVRPAAAERRRHALARRADESAEDRESGGPPAADRPSRASAAVVSAIERRGARVLAVVTITWRASTQLAARPCDVSAAATMRLLRISPVAAIASSQRGDHLAQHAQRADDALELVEFVVG